MLSKKPVSLIDTGFFVRSKAWSAYQNELTRFSSTSLQALKVIFTLFNYLIICYT